MQHRIYARWPALVTFLVAIAALSPLAWSFGLDIRPINFKSARPLYDERLQDAVAEPGGDSMAILQMNADTLISYPTLRVKVVGFTDDWECTGNECIQLSLRRASYVQDWLISHHVPRKQIVGDPEGHGSADPVGDPATEEGRARNRRVELQVISFQ